MPRALKFGITFILLVSGGGLAQNSGPAIEYDHRGWNILGHATAAFGPGALFDVRLLKSLDQTGGSGAGDPMYDVALLMEDGDKVVYRRPRAVDAGFYMDNELEIKDVTEEGIMRTRIIE
jgi:hypothetical protein